LDRFALLAVGAAVGLALARTGRRRLPPVPAPQQTAVPAPPAPPQRSRWERGAHVAQVAATAIAALALLFTAVSTYLSLEQVETTHRQWQASHVTQAVQNLAASDASTRIAALYELQEVLPDEHDVISIPAARALHMFVIQRCDDLHSEKPGVHEWEVQLAHAIYTKPHRPGWKITNSSIEFAETCTESGLPEDSNLDWTTPTSP
jgi:hypothetical protein